MSQKGLKKAAKIFSQIQEARMELIGTGTKKNDHQDILLGQMLGTGTESMKKTFTELTLYEQGKTK